MDKLIKILATGFYFGKAPIAPGTVGTIWGIPVAFLLAQLGPYAYMLGAIVFTIFAIFIAEAYEKKIDVHDAREVVIDEVVGYVIAMTWLPLTWQSFVAAFIVFRLLDWLKPFPIGMIDKKVKGGLGVVADDVVAGIITNFILQVVYTHTLWLGHQLLRGL